LARPGVKAFRISTLGVCRRRMRKIKKREASSPEKGEIIIYQTSDGMAALDVRLEQDTLWLSQKQLAILFQTERSVITKHLRNIFLSGELDKNLVCAKFAHTAEDRKTYQIAFYNLDAILSAHYIFHLILE